MNIGLQLAVKSQWCRGSTRVSGTLDPGSTPGWDVFINITHSLLNFLI